MGLGSDDRQAGKSYASGREALLLNAKFVAAQLAAAPSLKLVATDFINALTTEVPLTLTSLNRNLLQLACNALTDIQKE